MADTIGADAPNRRERLVIVLTALFVLVLSVTVATLKAHGIVDWLVWIGTVAVTLTVLGLMLRVVAAATG